MSNTQSINIVELAGLIYNQPTGKATPKSFVAKFMLQLKNKEGNGFKLVPVTIWGVEAQKVMDSFAKGDPIHIEGSIETGSYEKDGVKHYTWGVTASKILTEAVPF